MHNIMNRTLAKKRFTDILKTARFWLEFSTKSLLGSGEIAMSLGRPNTV